MTLPPPEGEYFVSQLYYTNSCFRFCQTKNSFPLILNNLEGTAIRCCQYKNHLNKVELNRRPLTRKSYMVTLSSLNGLRPEVISQEDALNGP